MMEVMKKYLKENNLTQQVRELVFGAGMSAEEAIEYVYDAHTLSNQEFASKYFG